MTREYIKAKQVMISSTDVIPEDVTLQGYLNNAARDIRDAGRYVWGSPITGNRAITADMHGQALLITANSRLALPKWSDLKEGWWLEFVPEDSYDNSRYKTYIDLFQGATIEEPVEGGAPDETAPVTYPADEMRGLFEYIKGDAVLVRSNVPNQFFVIGNAKYITKDELIALLATAKELEWWNHWYPKFFPAVPDAIAAADLVVADFDADGPAIFGAYAVLALAVNNLGIRIAFPCPYEFVNGDEAGNNTLITLDNIIHAGHEEAVRMVITGTETGGVITARQPKVANATITSLIGSAEQPLEYSTGDQILSKFNEWARAGSTVVGFEFQSDTAEEIDTTVVMQGEVNVIESAVPVKYVLTASIGTEYIAATSKLESVCTLKAEKFVSGSLIGTDSVTSRRVETYVAGVSNTAGTVKTWIKNKFSFGFYFNQNTGKVTFITQNGLVELDSFTSSAVSSGLFSTAFEKIDAFGIYTINATKNGYDRNTGTFTKNPVMNVDYIRAVHAWTLAFPDSTNIDCASRLWRPKALDTYTVSQIASEVTPSLQLAKVLSLVNIVQVGMEDAATVQSITSTVTPTLIQYKLVTIVNLISSAAEESVTVNQITSTVTPTLTLAKIAKLTA